MSSELVSIKIREDGSREVIRSFHDMGEAASRTNIQINQLNQTLVQNNNTLNQVIITINNYERSINNANHSTLRFYHTLANLHRIMGLLGLSFSIHGILKFADAWAEAEGQIRVFTKTSAEMIAVQDRLFEAAQRTRQPLETMVTLYARMIVSAKALNASQEDVIKVTENVNKVIAFTHVPVNTAKGTLLQLSQALGTGKVAWMDFKSVLTGMPFLAQTIANHFAAAGGSVNKLRQLIHEGKFSSPELLKAILDSTEDIDKAFAKSAKTFQQSFTVIENELVKYIGRLNEATGASNLFFSSAQSMSTTLPKIASSLLAIAAAGVTAFVLTHIIPYTQAIIGLFAIINAHPFVALASAIAGATVYLALMSDEMKVTQSGFATWSDVIPVVKSDFKSFFNDITDGMSFALTTFTEDAKEIDEVWGTNTTGMIKDNENFFSTNKVGLAAFVELWAKSTDTMGILVRATFNMVKDDILFTFSSIKIGFENLIISLKNKSIGVQNFLHGDVLNPEYVPDGGFKPLIPEIKPPEITQKSFADYFDESAAKQNAAGWLSIVNNIFAQAEKNRRAILGSTDTPIPPDLNAKPEGAIAKATEDTKALAKAAKEKSDIEKSIIKDNKEFEHSFDALVKKIDPVADGVKNYNEALKLIDKADARGMFDKHVEGSGKTATNLERAYQAILKIESAGGKTLQVNETSHALGQMQVLPSTLRDPGFGVKPFQPAIDQGITKSDSYESLIKFVRENEDGLKKFGEDYFKGLVKHYGSVTKAVNAYGEHTSAYMAKFNRYYAQGNKGVQTERDHVSVLGTKAEMIAKVTKLYEPALDIIAKTQIEMKRENELLSLNSKEREIAIKLNEITKNQDVKWLEANEAKIISLGNELRAQQLLREESQIKDSLLANSPQQQLKDFSRTSKVIDKTFPTDQDGNRPSGFATSIAGQVSSLGLDPNRGILGEDIRITNEQLVKDKITEIRKEFSDDMVKGAQVEADLLGQIESNKYQAILGQANDFFNTITPLMQSKNRSMAIAGKAAAIAAATISGILGVMKALEQAPPYSYALAAVTGAMAAVNVAKIATTPIGFMTGGSFVVGGSGGPDTQNVAFRATPGERVTVSTPTQVRKGDETNGSGSQAQQKPSVMKVANFFDKNLMRDFIETKDGEEVFMNFITRNSTGINNALRT